MERAAVDLELPAPGHAEQGDDAVGREGVDRLEGVAREAGRLEDEVQRLVDVGDGVDGRLAGVDVRRAEVLDDVDGRIGPVPGAEAARSIDSARRPSEPFPSTIPVSGAQSNDERAAAASSNAFSTMETGSTRKPTSACDSGTGTR